MFKSFEFKLIAAFILLVFPSNPTFHFNGIPLNYKYEWLFLISLLIFAVALLLKTLLEKEKNPSVSRVSSILYWSFYLILVVLKIYPKSKPYYDICYKAQDSPNFSTNCLQTSEKSIGLVDYGFSKTWTPGFLNTLQYNYYSCTAKDLSCNNLKNNRTKGAAAFEMQLSPRNSPIHHPVEITYIGSLAYLEKNDRWHYLPFSEIEKTITLDIEEIKNISYRNYLCKEKNNESCRQLLSYQVLPMEVMKLQFHENSTLGGVFEVSFLILCILLFLEFYLLFIRPLKSKQSIILLAFLVVAFFLLCRIKIPLWDSLELFEAGNDWLTYSSWAFDILVNKDYSSLSHTNMIFSKPLFLYFRTFLFWLLGDGTFYLKKTAEILLGLWCLSLSAFLLAKVYYKGFRDLIKGALFIYVYWLFLDSVIQYQMKFHVGMAEQPSWYFGGMSTLFLMALLFLSNNATKISFLKWGTAFAFLSVSARADSIFSLIIPLSTVFIFEPLLRKKMVFYMFSTITLFLCLLLFPIVSIFKDSFPQILQYLQINLTLPSPSNYAPPPSMWYSNSFKFSVFCFAIISLVACYRKSKFSGLILASLTLGLSLFLHLQIRDHGYYPRHYILLFNTLCAMILFYLLIPMKIATRPRT